jgi:predicted secreted Zn-dependent protease
MVVQAKENLAALYLIKDPARDRKRLVEMAYWNESDIVRLAGSVQEHITTARRSLSEVESALLSHGVFNSCGPLQNEQRMINVAVAELNRALQTRHFYVHIFEEGGVA